MAIGFNFRSTLAHVTDPTGTLGATPDETGYPTTNSGHTYGWTGGVGVDQSRDRGGYSDARFAGLAQSTAGYPITFNYDLPAAGTYPIMLGVADTEYGGSGGIIRIRDGVDGPVLLEINPVAAFTSSQAVDISNTPVAISGWDVNAAVQNLTFSSTRLVLELGDSVGDAGAASHLWIGDAALIPTLTISGDLQPGASFTLNYSNYDAVPVGPVTITDSSNNSITVSVTISDSVDGNGKHGGTAVGTYPALPTSGTAQGLLFGSVTVELGT